MAVVKRASLADLGSLRAVRLRALAESPEAFASTLERELAMTDDEWVARMERGAWFLAVEDGEDVGIVCSFPDPARPAAQHLVAMWVDPRIRGTTVAADLVGAVVSLSRAEGAGAVFLWVLDPNARARRFYERLGFVDTGDRQPLPRDPSIGETRLALHL
ncbi:MAG TPA: GNAT family N-acetyltransferase [Acidimicrobiales bacterium]|nr:GNAT family N-acetyltransferase [Acidimicrobiales bacterium]